MKVGVLTWFFAYNYGARAHSYALQQVIQDLGHECELITYYPDHYIRENIFMNLNFSNIKTHPILIVKSLIRCFKFRMTDGIYKRSSRVKTVSEIEGLGYDLIILGSDEVFKIGHPYFKKVYYGVGIQEVPMMSYAPSAGQTDVMTKLPDDIVKSLYCLEKVTVRDVHTRQLIYNNTDIQPEIVLDPTMLFDFKGISKSLHEKNYILIYSFDELNTYTDRIREYAKVKNFKIIAIGRYCAWADKSYNAISFNNWLGAFTHASLVITDSFHGTVFAIKNKIDFVIIGRVDKLNKINDLLEMLDIKMEFYNPTISIEQYVRNGLDYNRIDHVLNSKKQISIEIINRVIKNLELKGKTK